MLDRDSLDAALQSIQTENHFVAVNKFTFRSIALRHFLPPADPNPLHAAPSGPLGTRFVPPNMPYPSLYVALEVETAHMEGNQAFYQVLKTPGMNPLNLDPPEEVALIGVHAYLTCMLDIRDPRIQDRLETNARELASRWKLVANAPTQVLGHAVHASGSFNGILYSSAQNPGGSCMVIFPDRLFEGAYVAFRSRTAGISDARLENPGLPGLPT